MGRGLGCEYFRWREIAYGLRNLDLSCDGHLGRLGHSGAGRRRLGRARGEVGRKRRRGERETGVYRGNGEEGSVSWGYTWAVVLPLAEMGPQEGRSG